MQQTHTKMYSEDEKILITPYPTISVISELNGNDTNYKVDNYCYRVTYIGRVPCRNNSLAF